MQVPEHPRRTTSDDESKYDRRTVLKSGATALAAAGITGFVGRSSAATTASGGGPPNTDDWTLRFEDDFTGSSLDTSSWGVGFGWGRRANYSDGYAADENVSIRDDRLVLDTTTQSQGGKRYSAGVVHSKGNVEFGPGTYLECRIKLNDVPGCNQAFWSKTSRDPAEWPPEIDFFECPMHGSDSIQRTTHHAHWTGSGRVGDSSTHRSYSAGSYQAGRDLSASFVTIGCEWREDRLVWYADGQRVGGTSNSDIMRSINNGAPHYMMLSQAVDLGWIRSGTPSDLSGYKTTNEVDWVRVWNHTPNSGSGSGSGQSDGGSSDGGQQSNDGSDGGSQQADTERYLWVRSGDGSPVTFAFETSGGNVRLGSGGSTDGADYWVSDDTGGGTTAKTESLPGFWYRGSVTDLLYTGPIEVFVSDEPVDPDALGDRADGVITFDGSDGRGSYELSVSGSIGKSTADGVSVSGEDDVSGRTIEGAVAGGRDSYLFTGDVTAFDFDGSLEVEVNGEAVDPARLDTSG